MERCPRILSHIILGGVLSVLELLSQKANDISTLPLTWKKRA